MTKDLSLNKREKSRRLSPGLLPCLLIGCLSIVVAQGPSIASAASSEASVSAISSLNAGTAALQSGRSLEAIDFLNSAIESKALSAEGMALAYHHRGIAHQKLGLAGHAIADYTNAVWQGGLPEQILPRSYYNRAVAYAQMGQQDRAEQDYNKSIELQPDYAAAYHNRGNLRRTLGRHAEAADDYTRALELGMADGAHLTYFARALSYHALGNNDTAIDDTRQALVIKPDFPVARTALAEWDTGRAVAVAGNSARPTVSNSAEPQQNALSPSDADSSDDHIVTASLPTPAPSAVAQALAATAQAGPESPAGPKTVVASSVPIEQVRAPSVGRTGRGVLTLTPPNTQRVEPQTGSVTVAPLSEALPPPRQAEGWQATVTRFAPAVSQATSVASAVVEGRARAGAAVPAEHDQDLTTASIDTNQDLPTTPATASLDEPGMQIIREDRTQFAQNETNTSNDGTPIAVSAGPRVQIASFRSAADAASAWDKLARKYASIIGARQPYITEANLGERGTYYRLQIGGLASADEARSLCGELKAAGQDCILAR